MTGAGLAAVFAAGAAPGPSARVAAVPGSRNVNGAPEALATHDRPTALTRAFTGRLARGISNRFLEEHTDAAPRRTRKSTT